MDSKRFLHDVNFSLHEGEISLLLGPNGAGKSTLNLILAGILYPDEGQIRFSDQLLKHCRKTALYGRISRRPRTYTS